MTKKRPDESGIKPGRGGWRSNDPPQPPATSPEGEGEHYSL